MCFLKSRHLPKPKCLNGWRWLWENIWGLHVGLPTFHVGPLSGVLLFGKNLCGIVSGLLVPSNSAPVLDWIKRPLPTFTSQGCFTPLGHFLFCAFFGSCGFRCWPCSPPWLSPGTPRERGPLIRPLSLCVVWRRPICRRPKHFTLFFFWPPFWMCPPNILRQIDFSFGTA